MTVHKHNDFSQNTAFQTWWHFMKHKNMQNTTTFYKYAMSKCVKQMWQEATIPRYISLFLGKSNIYCGTISIWQSMTFCKKLFKKYHNISQITTSDKTLFHKAQYFNNLDNISLKMWHYFSRCKLSKKKKLKEFIVGYFLNLSLFAL